MPFYKLTPEILEELNQVNLKFSEYRLYLYCLTLDPYQDEWRSFKTAEVMRACNFKSPGTLYEALGRLRELGLLSFTFTEGKFSTTPIENQTTIATAIARSLQRSRLRHSDRTIATAIVESPESTEGADLNSRRVLKSLKEKEEAPRSEFFEELNPASEDYWKRLYGGNQA